MNVLEIRIGKYKFGSTGISTPTAEIYIDGQSFNDIISAYEMPLAYDKEKNEYVPYGHVPLAAKDLYAELTETCKKPEHHSQAILLGCFCGDIDCNPLYANIIESKNIIVWHSFFHPDHEDWDYSGLSFYVFDKKQYYKEINKLNEETF